MLIRDKYVFVIWRETRNSDRIESDKKAACPRASFKTETTGFLKPEVERPREPLALATMTSRFRVKYGSRQRGLIAISRDFQARPTRMQKRYMNPDNEFWWSRKILKSEIWERGESRRTIHAHFYISLYNIYSCRNIEIAFLCTHICLEFIIHNTIFCWVYEKYNQSFYSCLISQGIHWSIFFSELHLFWFACNIFSCYQYIFEI